MTDADIKRSLATRINRAMDCADELRLSKAEAFTVEDFTRIGERLNRELAIIDTLSAVWEDLYTYPPNRVDILNAIA